MGSVPSMTTDKVLEGQRAKYEALNDNAARSPRGEIWDRSILGNGNVERWSARDLIGVHELCRQLREGSAKIHDAVYVLGTIDPASIKVGTASDPIVRLAQLQTGNPERLYLHRVFWTLNFKAAATVEQTAHKFLERKTQRLIGEWFASTPTVAHDTIVNAFRSTCCGFIAATPNNGKEISFEKII